MSHSQLSTLHSPLIKEGYKQTEVGVIPDDWNTFPLDKLTEKKRPISYGIVQTGPNLHDGVPCLRVLDIKDGHVNKSNLIKTSSEISNSYRRTILKSGNLVMPLRGKIGEIAMIDDDLEGSNLTRGVAILTITDEYSPRYIKQFISSAKTVTRLESSLNGSALQELPIATVRSFRVTLPPTLAEQEAIAEALSDADSLIESLQQLIAKKRHIKQGAMQMLLSPWETANLQIENGKLRIENDSSAKNPQLKKGWVEKTLTDITEIRSGGTPSTNLPIYWDGNIPWCTPTDITRLKGRKNILTTSRSITLNGLKNSSAEIIPPNSLIMTTRATIGECAINPVEITTNQGFKNLTPKSECDVHFLYYLIAILRPKLIGLCSGSTFLEISKKQVAEFTVIIPPLPEQIRIATILSDMDEEISALETKFTKAKKIKQGMMSELLTGKTRLV